MKALITGASSGMGRDMAKILSQKGYDLILVARDEKKLEEVKKQLKTETKIVVMDISKEENCKKIYEENKDIDILINNAGFMPGPLMTTYYSTKNYVVRFSESIREELRRKKSKVQISILCPGPVDTNFNKVADVEFALKGLSSEYVAKYAINKFFKGKFYIVPGWKIKLARIGAKLAPASFVAKISYNMQKRKIR